MILISLLNTKQTRLKTAEFPVPTAETINGCAFRGISAALTTRWLYKFDVADDWEPNRLSTNLVPRVREISCGEKSLQAFDRMCDAVSSGVPDVLVSETSYTSLHPACQDYKWVKLTGKQPTMEQHPIQGSDI
jgi:hypothetical protein